MSSYSYRCVAAPTDISVKTQRARVEAVKAFEDIMNREAADGWEYRDGRVHDHHPRGMPLVRTGAGESRIEAAGLPTPAMNLTLDLSTDESIALRRVASEFDCTLEIAARAALRDWLVGTGYLEPEYELDEDTETEGEA